MGYGKTGPGTAHAIPADFYKLEDCKHLVEELSRREKKLHILVNNSGSNWGESYDGYPDHAWTRVLTLNLHRVFTITQLCTPLLEAAAVPGDGQKNVGDPARIINIGSVDGMTVPALETFAYSASKAGLHHMSEVLAHHLGRRNITCVSSSRHVCGFGLRLLNMSPHRSNTIACGPFESKSKPPRHTPF